MSIKLLVVGDTKELFFAQSESEYLKRLTKFVKLNYVKVAGSKKSSIREDCLKMEEEQINKYISTTDFVILLDENGEEYNSRNWAANFNENLTNHPNLTFVIGGAFGFSDSIKKRANAKWSLSKLTFPHHLVRTIFLEQLYRAFTILNGGKYHND